MNFFSANLSKLGPRVPKASNVLEPQRRTWQSRMHPSFFFSQKDKNSLRRKLLRPQNVHLFCWRELTLFGWHCSKFAEAARRVCGVWALLIGSQTYLQRPTVRRAVCRDKNVEKISALMEVKLPVCVPLNAPRPSIKLPSLGFKLNAKYFKVSAGRTILIV